ncbi:MAG: peptidoglycan bridge formation glycyltransferase FemA/FemB family protein [Patescibacteria group bacterium]
MKIVDGDKIGQEKWDGFIKNNSSDFGLLQSWNWGDFQSSLGKKVFRLVVVDDRDKILAVALIIKQKLKFGRSYFYLPRGPVMADNPEVLNFLFAEIKKLAKAEKVIFLRFDPAWLDNSVNQQILKDWGFLCSGQVQPQKTLILDLTQSEDKLSAQLKPKTRYNIKVAQKHCVKIDEGDNYFEDFWSLTVKTGKRDNITTHSKVYYQKMLSTLSPMARLKLIVAKYDNKPVAANLVAYFGAWCVYLHGASDYAYRDKMAPYLLQWEAILDAKARGLKYYDFWGADEAKWPGVTRFKIGFAPQNKLVSYVGSWDLVYDKFWFKLYNLIKKIKS